MCTYLQKMILIVSGNKKYFDFENEIKYFLGRIFVFRRKLVISENKTYLINTI